MPMVLCPIQRSPACRRGQISRGAGWRAINAANDLALLQPVIAADGFEVRTLQDGQATKGQIIDALSQAEADLQPGDIFFFHFSGHGQQVVDAGGDEFDGLDEALVPYDAPAQYSNNYSGQRHLLDDELGSALRAIRRKLGPRGQVFVTLDACHSGTATRGLGSSRGTDQLLAPPNFQVTQSGKPDEPLLEEDTPDAGMAPIISFSASSAQEANWEFSAEDGKRYGPLSYALGKVWRSFSNDGGSFQRLFGKIRAEMAYIAPRQTPRAEGALNQTVWGSESLPTTQPHFEVIMVANNQELRINGGLLHQLHPGTRLAFYPSDTRFPTSDKPIATGTIAFSELIRADVELDQPVSKAIITSAWIFVAEQNLGGAKLAVKLSLPSHPELAAELKKQLADYAALQLSEQQFNVLVEESPAGAIRVITSDEFILAEEQSYSPYADAVYFAEEVILKYAQAQYLKHLEYADPWLKARLELVVPAAAGNRGTTDGLLTLREGETFYMDVINEGSKACYINLLDIQPDSRIVSLIPGENSRQQPEDFLLQPGERKRLKSGDNNEEWVASPPLGYEMVKLIATEEPVDLRQIIQTRGMAEANTPLGKALARSFSMRHRGDDHPNISTGAACMASITLLIMKE
ncbi:MAG: caspase family protein [Saprospiraceae bacterium]|nr:caspase family protein [Saprospiraceae bacterium]